MWENICFTPSVCNWLLLHFNGWIYLSVSSSQEYTFEGNLLDVPTFCALVDTIKKSMRELTKCLLDYGNGNYFGTEKCVPAVNWHSVHRSSLNLV